MRKYYSLLFALLAVMAMALVFVACESDCEEPAPQIERPETSHIFMTTYKNVGEEVVLHFSQGGIVGLPPMLIGAEQAWQYDLEGNLPKKLKYKLTAQSVIIEGKIKYLESVENGLSSLDVSMCPALETLLCGYNSLKQIDLSSNPNLTELNCAKNHLTELDLSHNPELLYLSCSANLFTELDLSHNPKLKSFTCTSYDLTRYRFSLSSLNLEGCEELEFFQCCGHKLTSLDLSGNTKLKELYCYENELTSLNLKGCESLKKMQCFQNNLTSLDLSDCVNLEYFSCFNNNITGEGLTDMINLLPDRTGRETGSFCAFYRSADMELALTEEHKAILASKNWEVKSVIK